MKYSFSFLGLDSVSALLFRSTDDFLIEKDPDEHIVILTKATTYSPQLVATCDNDTCCSQNALHQECESHPLTTRMSHKEQSKKSVRFDEARNQTILLIDSPDTDTVDERWYSGVDLMHFKYSTSLLAKTIRQSEARNNTRKLYHLVHAAGGGRRFEQRTPGNCSTSGPAITIAFAHCCQLCASSSNDIEEKPCGSSANSTNSNNNPSSLLPHSVQTQLQHWLESPHGGTGGWGPLRWGLAFAASATMMQERTQRRRELYQVIRNHQQQQYESLAREHQVPSKNRYTTDIDDESYSSSWWSFLTGYDSCSDSNNSSSDEEDSCMTTTTTSRESGAEPMESFAVDADEELRQECQRISQPSVLFARELALAQAAILQREG